MHILALLAALYALLRFVMAFGLWFEKRWAQWLVALSAAIYLPLEAHELAQGFNGFVIGALALNVLVVALIAALRRPRPGASAP